MKRLLLILSIAGLLYSYYIEDPRYHKYSEVIEELKEYGENYPNIVHFDTIGFSTRKHQPIVAVKISDNASMKEDEPVIFLNGVHHAEEVLGCEVLMELVDFLTSHYQSDSQVKRWVDNEEIWIVPVLNPDGHDLVTSTVDTGWRKNTRDNNNNGVLDLDYDGVDLNRNYDFYWETGDSEPSAYFYRGPYPFSEGETQAVKELCERELPVVAVNYHSPSYSLGEVIYYPWILNGELSPDYQIIRNIAVKMASHIINDAHDGHYLAVSGDGASGKARNWMYGTLGIISLTIEICSQRVQVPPDEVDDIVLRNLQGIFWLLDRVLGSGVKVNVRHVQTGEPLEACVYIPSIDSLGPPPPYRKTDPRTGSLYRLLDPGEYQIIVEKEGFRPETLSVTVNEERVDINVSLTPENPLTSPFTVPFRRTLKIPLNLEKPSRVELKIYDITGRLVKNIGPLSLEAGLHTLNWDGRDKKMKEVPSGVYILKLYYDSKLVDSFKVVKIEGGKE